MTDPIADLLIRIKNAQAARHTTIEVPYSGVKENLVKILIKNRYLIDYKIEGEKPHLNLKLTLKYVKRLPSVREVKRISKPGVRHFTSHADLDRLTIGRGLVIISTNKGLMTAHKAKEQHLGGEIICKIN